jgi:hypothetical protein
MKNANQTWSMQDMGNVFLSEDSTDNQAPAVIEIASAVPKPAHHNSKIKAALLLGGGVGLAALGCLVFSLMGGQSQDKSVATAPENEQSATAVTNDGWETAAKGIAADAGQAINIPGKKDGTESPTPSPATAAGKTDSNTAVSQTPSTSPTTPAVVQIPAVASTNSRPTNIPVSSTVPSQVPVATAKAPAPSVIPRVAQPPAAMTQVKSSPIAKAPAPSVIPRAAQPPAATTQVKSSPIAKAPDPSAVPRAAQLPVASTQVESSPIAKAPAPSAVPRAAQLPVASTQVKSSPIAKAPAPTSWEQASDLGVYGGDGAAPAVQTIASKNSDKADRQQQISYDGPMSPILLLAAGTNVKGHTLAPFTVGVSDKQSEGIPLSIALDEAIELSQGYRLPAGTTINFIASVRDNGSVVAVSKNADIGGVEIQLPPGVITLAAENNGALMAKEINASAGDLARADANSSLWGGVAGAGRAILQSGSQTTTQNGLLGATTQTTNNGNPNIFGAVLEGAFTPLATNGQKRAQQLAQQIEGRTRLSVIDVNTRVRLFVNVPVQVQIPLAGQSIAQAPEREVILPPPPLQAPTTQTPPVVIKPVPSAMPETVLRGLPSNPARTRIESLK